MPFYSFSGKNRAVLRVVTTVLPAGMLAGCTVVSLSSPGWPPATAGQAPSAASGSVSAMQPDSAKRSGRVDLAANWVGHYEGIAPCADCAGVRTVLTLKQDGSYTLSLSYMDSNKRPHIVHGHFTWSSDETEITLDEKGGQRRYAVSWSELRMLQRDGSPMLGLLGEQVVLKKRPS